MIRWFNKNEKQPIATIYKTNITINKPGLEILSSAYAAQVGIDEEKKEVVLRPVDLGEYESGLYDKDSLFVLSGGSSYTRISSTEFVNQIGELLKYDFKAGPKKFVGYYDTKRKYFVIDLNREAD